LQVTDGALSVHSIDNPGQKLIAQWMGFSHIDYIGEYAAQLATHAPELVGDERADAALMR
jgi:hypothetical protein